MSDFTATAEIDVAAAPDLVWAALTQPEQIETYMEGSQVETTWEVGSPITWDGEYEGRDYQDKGEVLAYDEPNRLSVTHYSPLMGDEDVPESYHKLVWTLTSTSSGGDDGTGTHLELTQDGCASEEQAEQFSKNWKQMLEGLKTLVEG